MDEHEKATVSITNKRLKSSEGADDVNSIPMQIDGINEAESKRIEEEIKAEIEKLANPSEPRISTFSKAPETSIEAECVESENTLIAKKPSSGASVMDNKCDSKNDTDVHVNTEPNTAATSSDPDEIAKSAAIAEDENNIPHSTKIVRPNIRNKARCYRQSLVNVSSPSSSSTELPQDEVAAPELNSPDPNIDIENVTSPQSTSSQQSFENIDLFFPRRTADNEATRSSSSDSSSSSEENSFEIRSLHAVPSALQLSLQRRHSEDRSNNDNSSTYSDDDDDMFDDDEDVPDENKPNSRQIVVDVLNKPKPNYTWNSTIELMRREHGLAFDGRSSVRNSLSFNSRVYSSLHLIERMKLSSQLRKHSGCVNSLNFNRIGDLLCSGSDDLRIIVWDWAHKKTKYVFKSGHSENIFQTKFVTTDGFLDIISSSRDGQVRRSIITPGGGRPQTSMLYKHRVGVHKLVITPSSTSEVISAGEDGVVRKKDLRTDEPVTEWIKVVTSDKKPRKVRLFSIAHNPFAPEICVSGCDKFVRVYDKRNVDKVVHEMCPESLIPLESLSTMPQITCAVFNDSGSEILASYSDDNIYLFDNKNYKTGKFLHQYRGHYNHRTIKGVNFFGPRSEYIISGSDCGNIFYWDKNTEAIVNFMPGDNMGVVNCLEAHPSIPILATSGLDSNIKIWTPSSETYPPDLSKLESCITRNLRRSLVDEANHFDDRQFHYFIRQFLRGPLTRAGNNDDSPNFQDPHHWSGHSSSSSSTDDDNDDNDDELPQLEGIQCRTQ